MMKSEPSVRPPTPPLRIGEKLGEVIAHHPTEPSFSLDTEFPYPLGPTNPCPMAVHMEPFARAVGGQAASAAARTCFAPSPSAPSPRPARPPAAPPIRPSTTRGDRAAILVKRSNGQMRKRVTILPAGHSGVMVGRPWLYGLGAAGGAGVTRSRPPPPHPPPARAAGAVDRRAAAVAVVVKRPRPLPNSRAPL